ncbi:hypothetical protein LCGC14_2603960 [marine sediment metagenome]|uniref:DUF7678 domain-containing protein n=1 Tax=marine sediment metagenome TaxID=412755 RepID=A0A0F9AVK6_9ZZZZ
MTVEILSPHEWTGWITAVMDGHWFQAKVYDNPSTFGINDGRVSKLAILKESRRNLNESFLDQVCFNYDRELDFDEAPVGLVDKIVEWCEKLDKLEDSNESLFNV